MMEISAVSSSQAGEYVAALQHLIRSTITMPSDAIQYYVNQWTAERLRGLADSWVFLTAKQQSKIHGVVLGTPVEGGVATIIWVLVDQQLQNKGIGSLLFREACRVYEKKGAHKVKLTVPDEQTVNFYLKQGMILEGVHKNHWWKSDFWAMGIQL